MSQLFAGATNDLLKLNCSLNLIQSELICPAQECEQGWGLGFHQSGDILMKKRPHVAEENGGRLNYYEELKSLITNCFMLQTRSDNLQSKLSENANPFKYRQWFMSYLGACEQLPDFRHKILEDIPDYIARNIRGRSEGELMFHWLMSQIIAAGLLVETHRNVDLLLPIFESFTAKADALWQEHHVELSPRVIAVSNGEIMCIINWGREMHMLSINGISECEICSNPYNAQGIAKDSKHSELRSILFHSALSDRSKSSKPREAHDEAHDENLQWEQIPARSVVFVDRATHHTLHPLA